MKRKRAVRSVDRRIFTKSAKRVKSVNLQPTLRRGGIRF